MRSLFYVGAKLLGIVYLSTFLISIISTINFTQYDRSSLSCPTQYTITAGYILGIVINLIFSYLLLFRTNDIAKILKIENTEHKIENLSINSFIYAGIVLIGIYIFASNIGTFLNAILFFITTANSSKNIDLLGTHHKIFSQETTLLEVIVSVIPIVLSLLFIFKADTIVKLINKNNK